MRNKQISLKYKAMQSCIQDLDLLVSLGFAEWVIDPKTNEGGYKITQQGINLLKKMEEDKNE